MYTLRSDAVEEHDKNVDRLIGELDLWESNPVLYAYPLVELSGLGGRVKNNAHPLSYVDFSERGEFVS